jgi:hypothetical protein
MFTAQPCRDALPAAEVAQQVSNEGKRGVASRAAFWTQFSLRGMYRRLVMMLDDDPAKPVRD